MNIFSFYKNMVRGNYENGHRLTSMVTKNMSPRKGAFLGTLADVALGGLVTFLSASPLISSVIGTVAAVTAAIAAPAAIPSALLAIGGTALWTALGVPMVAMGVGFFSSARERMHIPSPAGIVSTAGHAMGATVHAIEKPFKWAGHKLSHAFKKAHDDVKIIEKKIPVLKRIPGRPGHFDI